MNGRIDTHNSNEMISRGAATTLLGEKVSSPFEPPTTTLMIFKGFDGDPSD